ncbi:unnamed protein product [Echinostoma caproni]|uniref:BRCT domain-containing protein n=1 Tax=Echinostoma caproni TaxID=27848 RepID=A0A183ACV5_9TREM|nr:unnamed protein product [Echinostoma caproni]
MASQRRSILLFVNNAPCHNQAAVFFNVKSVRLPLNCPAVLPPMDQGMIWFFEYEQRIMKAEVDILMAMHLVKKACVSVRPHVLISAFMKEGLQFTLIRPSLELEFVLNQAKHRKDEDECEAVNALEVISIREAQKSLDRLKPFAVVDARTSCGLPIYGRWHFEPYYYAGWIREHSDTGVNYLVTFEDGSEDRLRAGDILLLNLLPMNTNVFVDWKNNLEYQGNCSITAHTNDPWKPYEIRRDPDGLRRTFRRKNVAIHHKEVLRLRGEGILPDKTTDSVLRKALLGTNINYSKSDLGSLDDRSVVSDVSLANMVFGKRVRKIKRPCDENEKEPELDRTQIRKTPEKRQKLTGQHSNRRTLRRSALGAFSRHPRTRVISGSEEEEEEGLTQPMSIDAVGERTQTRDCLRYLPVSQSRGPRDSANYYLRRTLSRSLNLPIPSCSLFRGWTIIFTGRFPHVFTSPAGSAPGDRETLKKLVLATGGQVSTSDLKCKENQSDLFINYQKNRVALVASGPCRTMRYFQALATLGRVPLLRTKWIVDAVRYEASESQNVNDDNNPSEKCTNWPLRLLLDHPGRYELSRGMLTTSGEWIEWSAVPIHYLSTSSSDDVPTPSLFKPSVDWSTETCKVIAIVTDDTDVFGPSWSTILRLAHGSKIIPGTMDPQPESIYECHPIPTFSVQDSVAQLSTVIRSQFSPQRSSARLVLVDRSKLTERILSALQSLPVRLVTCDYFIQSLICGRLLDPDASPHFIPTLVQKSV